MLRVGKYRPYRDSSETVGELRTGLRGRIPCTSFSVDPWIAARFGRWTIRPPNSRESDGVGGVGGGIAISWWP
jgi:hypothetical protein